MLSRVLPPHGAGGMAAAAWDLALAFARAGAEVRVLTTAGGAALDTSSVRVLALDAPAARYSSQWWRRSCATFEALGSWPQVVLGVSAAANALAHRRTPGSGPPFLFQAHGTSSGEIVSKLRGRRPRDAAAIARSLYWGLSRDHAYRRYDAVVAVGEAVRRQLTAWPTAPLLGATPVALIRNGIEPSAFRFDPARRAGLRSELGLDDATPLALFAARLQSDKGADLAIEAVRRARLRGAGVRLALVGTGREAARLDRRVAAHGLAPWVHRAGEVDRSGMAAWFSAADVLLFPTRRVEGLPLVVLEALASGLQVLATPAAAADPDLPCRRLAGDDVDGFAAALAEAKPSAGPRPSLLPAGFHLDRAAADYLHLFDALLARGTEPRAA